MNRNEKPPPFRREMAAQRFPSPQRMGWRIL
jgi:hypothetical protein